MQIKSHLIRFINRITLILTCGALSGFNLFAQTFPVQITTTQLPPYTPFLSDFSTPGPDRLRLQIVLLDSRQTRYQVKLRLTIQGNGILIKSNPGIITKPITLDYNVPLILTNNDLRELFDPATLDFDGISTDGLGKSGKLPEGSYTICAEVFDFIRDETPISNQGCSIAFLQELDPPDIVSPGDEIIPVFPQQYLVSWIPRHIGLIAVEYQLDIFEKIPGIADQQLTDLTNPLIRYRGPFLNYRISPEDPPLQIGKEYIARVRVKDPGNRYTFKNDGYSPLKTFRYGKICEAPVITETKLRANFIDIRWIAKEPLKKFDLRYRYKDTPWQSVSTDYTIYSLPISKIGGSYEFQVGSGCYDAIKVNSDIAKLTLNKKNLPADYYACGLEIELEERSSTPLSEELHAGDTIIANGMRLVLTSIINTGNTYSGSGAILFPMFGKIGIQCSFTGIALNEDKELIAGNIKVTGAGGKLLKDSQLQLLDGLLETLKTSSNVLSMATASSALEYLQRFDAFIPADIKNKLDSLQELINTTSDETIKRQVTKELELIVTQYVDMIEDLLDADFQVRFIKDDRQEYGFDGLDPQPLHSGMRIEYEKMTIAGYDYYIPYKSLELNKGDVVQAKVVDLPSGFDPDRIRFRTNLSDTAELPATRTGDTWSITLPSIPAKGHYFVLAGYLDEINAGTDSSALVSRVAGMLKVIAYPRKTKSVVLVPLNTTTPPNAKEIEREINKIFDQAVVSWAVSTAPAYNVPGYDGILDSIRSGFLANYTREMQDIIRGYSKQDTLQYYLFITKAEGSGLAGFMPRGRNYGFIVSTDAKTIAHELGHGYGVLEHSKENYSGLTEGSTDLLMDYNSGVRLMHREWELLQNPPGIIPWFQTDREGQRVLQQSFYHDRYVYFQYTGAKDCYASITPSGQKINLPSNAIASYYPSDGGAWPKGSLTGFVIEKTVYLGWWSESNRQFYGYAPVNDKNEVLKPYYTGVAGSCISYAGFGNDLNCTQTIVSDSASALALPYAFGDSAKIRSLLPLAEMDLYETGQGVKGPCGCYTGPCREALEKFKNHPYLSSKSPLSTAICANPCLLNHIFLEYDHFPEGQTAWMNDFNTAFGTLLHIGIAGAATGVAAPMTADLAGTVFINSIRELIKLKGKDFIIGFTFDLLVQRAIHDVFNPDKPLILDYPQALASALEATLALKSAIGETAVNAAIECFVSGHFDDGKIKDDFDVKACAKGALWATLIQGGLKVAGYGIRQIPKDKFIDGLIDLIASKDPSLLKAGPIDDQFIWSIYKLFNPVPLKADDIQHLFNTSRLDETTDTWINAIHDPAIQKTLLEEGFYLKFRKLEGVNNEERKEMLRELLARAKTDGDGGKKAVGEWETKINGNWIGFIGKNIEELTEAPIGYQFYYRDDQKFIRRINASDPNTPQLSVKYGKIVRAVGQVLTNADEIKLLLKTEKNTAYFWSGRTSKGEGVKDMASDIARKNGGTTLEDLIEKYKIIMPEWNDKLPEVVKLWEDVSALYANQVSGEVKAVLGKSLRIGNVWETIELPRLKSNTTVSKIISLDPETKIEILLWEK